MVLFTFSHRITSDIEAAEWLHSLPTHLHHPRFQGSSLIFLFLFFIFLLFSLWLIRGDASSSSSNGPLGAISPRPASPSSPHPCPARLVHFSSRCCGDTTQLSALLVYTLLDSRSHWPDSLDSGSSRFFKFLSLGSHRALTAPPRCAGTAKF